MYKPRILISRYHVDNAGKKEGSLLDIALEYRQKYELLVDSGAFTAHTLGFEYSVDEYCEWVKTHPLKPERYIQLDVIGDEIETVKNLEVMVNSGTNPIPVFTRGSSLETLERMYQIAPFIAIGGLVGTKNNAGYVKYVQKHIKDRPVHWLGFTRLSFISRYRPSSCDSSGWVTTRRYGGLRVYLGKGKWKTYTRDDLRQKPTIQLRDGLAQYDIDVRDLGHEANWRIKGNKTSIAHLTATRSWARYVLDVKEKYGTDLYSVIMLPLDLTELIKGFDWVKENFIAKNLKDAAYYENN